METGGFVLAFRQALSRDSAAQFAAPAPEFARLQDARRRNDPGNQLRRGDIEAGIQSPAGRVGHARIYTPSRARRADSAIGASRHTPGAKDFARVTLFDRDVEAGLDMPVDGGERDSDVEWDTMPRGQHGLRVSADLISHLAGAAQRA